MATTENSEILQEISDAAEKTNSRSSSVCIYRVGRELRELKGSAYTPHLVSIGPFHNKDEYLSKRSGNIKLSYAKSLFNRISESEKIDESSISEHCLKKMNELLDEAKKSYPDEVDAELDAKMMLIDGCFILEFLYRKYVEDKKISNTKDQTDQQISKTKDQKDKQISSTNQSKCKNSVDPIFGSVPTRLTVQDDLLLLENQLPFKVLQTLYDLTLQKLRNRLSLYEYVNQIIPKLDPVSNSENNSTANSKNNPTESGSLPECCVVLFSDKNKQTNNSVGEEKAAAAEDDSKKEPPMHILDFIHKKYRPLHHLPHKKKKKINTCSKFMFSASELDYAGVKFEAPKGAQDNIFEVNFKEVRGPFHLFQRARFQIPTLCIDDSTERLLRNLIAFEQCRPGVECYITSYAFLMDRLINTAKDVEVLQKAGVIRNYLRANEEASDIFNKLCKEVELGGFSYAQTCEEVAQYSEHLWPEFMAYVRYTYFYKPWTVLAFFIAFIGFGASLGNFILNLSRNPPNK